MVFNKNKKYVRKNYLSMRIDVILCHLFKKFIYLKATNKI